MAVSGRCSGGRGVCEPLATLGCDGHAVNDTMLAHGQLLVDDPERIGPIQATGKDQTLFNRFGEGPHPAVDDHIRLPPKTRRASLMCSLGGCGFDRLFANPEVQAGFPPPHTPRHLRPC